MPPPSNHPPIPSSPSPAHLIPAPKSIPTIPNPRATQINPTNRLPSINNPIYNTHIPAINFDSRDACTRQTITGFKLFPDQGHPWWAADPKFAHIVRSIHNTTGSVAKKDTKVSIRETLKQASSLSQVQHIVEEALVGKIASVSMTPKEDVDLDKPLAAYGMDSLVAVEMRSWITNEMAANIPALEFIASSSLAGLTQVIIGKSTLVDVGAMSASATE